MIELRPAQSFWQDFKNNQIAGLWLFIGSRRAFEWVSASGLQFLVWGVLAAAANTLFSWLIAGEGGHFNSQGLVSYALWPFLALIVGIFLAQRSGISRLLLVPATLWLILDANLALLQCLIQYLGQLDYLPNAAYDFLPMLFMLLFVWQSAAVVWIFSKEFKWPWWERLLILVATLFTMIVWQSSVKSQPIWKVEPVQPTFAESSLYAQAPLLQDSFDKILFGDYNRSDWYFLGVAGASYQNVFRSEIERIREQFDTRFGTFGRSMVLINHPETGTQYPIASLTSIDRSLQHIGQVMNRESDVLFMYLTSHGLANHFQLENAPLDLEQMDPTWLKKAIERSGIRWRVIVISACFSGSFARELASPDSLLITAAASDKESFGCTNEADYTYFGRAFFDQALREKSSFKAAFDDAKQTVAKWESAQGFEPSEPQWILGKNMELMLPQLEQQLFPQPQKAIQ